MKRLSSVSLQWRLEQSSSTEPVCSPTVSWSAYVSLPYSFAATGLAFIPLTGVAIYVLKIWTEGRYIWLLTSLVGTAAIVGACALMRNRVMAYLLISFIVSDSLAATKVAALPFVWYLFH